MKMRKNIRTELRSLKIKGLNLKNTVEGGSAILNRLSYSNRPKCYPNCLNANLRGANLRGANLRDAILRDADLRDADLTNAVLTNADLRDADLRGAIGVSLYGTKGRPKYFPLDD